MTLTYERLRELLHYDPETGVFTRLVATANCTKVGDVVGSPDGHGYLVVEVNKRKYLLHRLAWFYITGAWPPNDIDHEDRIGTNNWWKNLRPATRKQNCENCVEQTNNTSGHRGVHWRKESQKWVARIVHHKRRIALGYYACKEEAIEIRELAEAMLFTHAPKKAV